MAASSQTPNKEIWETVDEMGRQKSQNNLNESRRKGKRITLRRRLGTDLSPWEP